MVRSCFLGAILAASVALANNPPHPPLITEPAFDGRIVNPEDVHMETGPFSDPNPGDTHTCTDWEIWSLSPFGTVWQALCLTGVERLHCHLGDGVFTGTHSGRTSLRPGWDYFLRVRHRDSSGDPNTQWSEWSYRYFTAGQLSQVFPLEIDDVADAPTPEWVDTTGIPITLPNPGPNPAELRLESPHGDLLLTIRAAGGFNLVINPGALDHHVPIRVVVHGGSTGFSIPESDLHFSDGAGAPRTIYLPVLTPAPGETRVFWVAFNGGTFVGDPGQTDPDFSIIARGAPVPFAAAPGYRVEVAARGFRLPVNIAFVPNPRPEPEAPLYYVTELYGTIRVVRRDGVVGTYATNLLNFNPTGNFPGSGEQGVTGIVVHPETGDVFAAMLYDAAPPNGPHYPKVDRFTSTDGGLTAAQQVTILDMVGETQGQSHQISNLSIGPDGRLYVHMGDGFVASTGQNLDSFRGKILRVNLDGTAPADNPFYDPSNGINARDYVYAYGLRNPFGGTWRAADSSLYMVENGPTVDRMARIVRGRNYLWNGTDDSMRNYAIYNWQPSHAPVNCAFIQPSTFNASGFPPEKHDHFFVTESGPTWSTGPQSLGKRITEFVLNAQGELVSGPIDFVVYNGSGKATCVGLAAGPDGLYFTDLYKDIDYQTPTDVGANVLRIRFVGEPDFSADVVTGHPPLTVHFTDLSTVPGPTGWVWSFGDGASSTERNPVHTYTSQGVFGVRLAVNGANGPAARLKPGFIRVGSVPRLALIGAAPLTNADHAVAQHLRSIGYIVETFPEQPGSRPTAGELAAQFQLVLISSSVFSNNIGGEFRTANVPLIFWEQALLRADREALADSGIVNSGVTQLNITDNSHPITAGLPLGPLTVFTSAQNMSQAAGIIAPNASVLATRAGASNPALLVAEAGATLLGGYVTPARRVFLFFEDSSFLGANDAARNLLNRAVCWSINQPPVITTQPEPLTVQSPEPAVFSVGATGALLNFRWRKDQIPLNEGGPFSGVFSSTLTINPTSPAVEGVYDVIVSSNCGGVSSQGARLTVVVCIADFNGDGQVDFFDYLDFVQAFSDEDPSADINGDGQVDFFDYLDFVQAFSNGC